MWDEINMRKKLLLSQEWWFTLQLFDSVTYSKVLPSTRIILVDLLDGFVCLLLTRWMKQKISKFEPRYRQWVISALSVVWNWKWPQRPSILYVSPQISHPCNSPALISLLSYILSPLEDFHYSRFVCQIGCLSEESRLWLHKNSHNFQCSVTSWHMSWSRFFRGGF